MHKPRSIPRASALAAIAWLAACTGDDASSSASSIETAADDTDSSTGDGPPFPEVPAGECGRPDLARAQPAVLVDGVAAVPIDVESVEATFLVDAAVGVASAEATLRFVSGGADGRPVLDLRQQVTALTFNGEALAPGDLSTVDFGGGDDAELRILEAEAAACTENLLEVAYELATPRAPGAHDLDLRDPGRVRWNFDLNDGAPGRFLEQWAPANLIHDQHTIALEIEVVGATVPHVVVSNAAVEVLAEGSRWRLTWPATANAMSPLVVVWPADELVSQDLAVELPGGSIVTVSVHKPFDFAQDLVALALQAADALIAFTGSTGPYAHGDRFTVVMGIGDSAMEYDGGTVLAWNVLEHEVFHSWYGRGVRPATQPDGWIDEGWASYNTTPGPAFAVEPLDLDLPPFTLRDDNPWSRVWSSQSYGIGNALFAGIAAIVGLDPLRDLMADFYQEHTLEAITTEDLEAHLACRSGHAPQVRAIFHRYVYGHDGPPPTEGRPACGP